MEFVYIIIEKNGDSKKVVDCYHNEEDAKNEAKHLMGIADSISKDHNYSYKVVKQVIH